MALLLSRLEGAGPFLGLLALGFGLALLTPQPGYIKYKNRLIGKLYVDAGILVRFKGMVSSRAYLPTTGNTPGDELYVSDQYHPWIWAGASRVDP